ncbi:MAG: isoprenyl transferase [Bacteroidales bacterium]|jgi:undecaprenyl diphosphate synthase|nr:isoprenyl transferase [Bacteroidales bacterium]
MESFKSKLDKKNIPEHIAIIMDGNGRWAQKQGATRVFGHKNAIDAVRSTIEGAGEIGVKYVTLFAFSIENWERPKVEVDTLMELLIHAIDTEIQSLIDNNVKLNVIGDISKMPDKVREKIFKCIKTLESNTGLNLILALSYSSKWEIIEAVKKIAQEVKDEKIEPNNIDDKLFCKYLATYGFPDPELLIRTSGEQRISNFLLWQIVYSELYFTKTLWPDFNKENLFEAIYTYQHRERRFGKTNEQLKS